MWSLSLSLTHNTQTSGNGILNCRAVEKPEHSSIEDLAHAKARARNKPNLQRTLFFQNQIIQSVLILPFLFLLGFLVRRT